MESNPPTRQPLIQGRRVYVEPIVSGMDGGDVTSQEHQGKGRGGRARRVLSYRQRPPSEPPPEMIRSVNDMSTDTQASDDIDNITSPPPLVTQKKRKNKRTRKDKGRAGHRPPPITFRHKSDPHHFMFSTTGVARGCPREDSVAGNNNNNNDVRHQYRRPTLHCVS